MDYNMLAEQLFYKGCKLKKFNNQQMIEESMQGGIFTLLYMKNKKGIVLPGEISEEMDISSARVATILNNLENKGLIERRIDKSDRRRILVVLTKEGETQAEQRIKKVIGQIAKMLELLGEEDAEEFVRITGRILDLAYEAVE